MSENAGTPMPEDLSPIEYLREGVRRLGVEVECVSRHLDGELERTDEENDLVSAALHLSSIVEGVKVVSNVLMSAVMDPIEQATVAAALFQKRYGVPMKVEVTHLEGMGDIIELVQDDFDIPDNLGGLGETE